MPASTGYATWNEAAKQAEAWSDIVLACRIRGHAWEQVNSGKERGGYIIYFDCTRECGVRRIQHWDRRGRVLSSSMSYPKAEDGEQLYLSTIGRLDSEARGALRIATLERRGEK